MIPTSLSPSVFPSSLTSSCQSQVLCLLPEQLCCPNAQISENLFKWKHHSFCCSCLQHWNNLCFFSCQSPLTYQESLMAILSEYVQNVTTTYHFPWRHFVHASIIYYLNYSNYLLPGLGFILSSVDHCQLTAIFHLKYKAS